jgi:hypothetical protein
MSVCKYLSGNCVGKSTVIEVLVLTALNVTALTFPVQLIVTVVVSVLVVGIPVILPSDEIVTPLGSGVFLSTEKFTSVTSVSES